MNVAVIYTTAIVEHEHLCPQSIDDSTSYSCTITCIVLYLLYIHVQMFANTGIYVDMLKCNTCKKMYLFKKQLQFFEIGVIAYMCVYVCMYVYIHIFHCGYSVLNGQIPCYI